MAEYVEREKVLSKAAPVEGCFSDMISAYDVIMLPAADVAPVRHGRWVNTHSDSEFVQCCLCKYPVYAAWNVTNYCPNCGAKMEEQINEKYQ